MKKSTLLVLAIAAGLACSKQSSTPPAAGGDTPFTIVATDSGFTLPDTLHGALRRPALQEVEAFALLLQQLSAQSLVQVTAEKIEALFAIIELDLPRLVRM